MESSVNASIIGFLDQFTVFLNCFPPLNTQMNIYIHILDNFFRAPLSTGGISMAKVASQSNPLLQMHYCGAERTDFHAYSATYTYIFICEHRTCLFISINGFDWTDFFARRMFTLDAENWDVDPFLFPFHDPYPGESRRKNFFMGKGAYKFTDPASSASLNICNKDFPVQSSLHFTFKFLSY